MYAIIINKEFTKLGYLHDGDIVGCIEGDVVHLRDEDRSDGHEQRGAVHVDRGPDREDELTDPPIYPRLLETLEVDW